MFVLTTTATATEEQLNGGRPSHEGDSLTDAAEVRDVYGHALAQVLDAGLVPGDPSTVLSLVGDSLEVLRQGVGVVAS